MGFKGAIKKGTSQEDLDTVPKLLLDRKNRYPHKISMRKRLHGIWNEYAWEEVYEKVKHVALGLLSLGLQRGDRTIIIGDNDPQYFWAEWAVMSIGGVTVGVYIDCAPDEIKYFAEHSEATFVFAKDQEQVDKVLAIKKDVPKIKKVIYWDDRGLWWYEDPGLIEFNQLEALGREYEKTNSGLFEDSIKQGKASDIALFCYTSGTTGVPKAAMISYSNLLFGIKSLRNFNPYLPADNYVSYISPAWITEQLIGLTGGVSVPLIINFPESPETVQADIRDIGPHIIFYGARLWESLSSSIQVKIADSSAFRMFCYNLASKISLKRVALKEKRASIGLILSFLHRLADFVVFRPLRDRLGLSKVSVAYTAGAAISPDMMRLFHSIGVNIKNLYGSTESLVMALHRDDDIRYETVGVPFDGCEIRISSEGEILCKSDMVFGGYYKNPEATQKVLKEGFYHTGDAGYFDKGHLIYQDRVGELIEIDSVNRFSPQFLESRLRFSPYIMDGIVFGGRDKPFPAAILAMNFDNVSKWAEKKKIAYTTFLDLSQKESVRNLLKKVVSEVNSFLPEHSKVRAFVCLHKALDPDEAELTRTRKLKRKMIEEKYEDILISIYNKKEKIPISTQVIYRDGRVGTVKTELIINYI
jgi:long-chain acyl-CoA synthetase